MHHTKEKKYRKLKESGVTQEELLQLMLTEEVPAEEAEVFLTDLFSESPAPSGGDQVPAISKEISKPKASAPIQATTTTKVFDYENLNGDEFKAYSEHVAGLDLFKEHDYLQYKVEVIMTERYPGLPGTPVEMTGIRITNNKPLHTTRISPKTAGELNAQVRNSGRYYLLKQ